MPEESASQKGSSQDMLRMPAHGVLSKHARSELDRRIDRKIAAARARIARTAASEFGLWGRLRLVWMNWRLMRQC
jgi:hypothetical protein